jgi:hypothetical protein
MPFRLAELELPPGAIEVLKEAGMVDLEALAQAKVTDVQALFIQATREGRYPDKSPSLVQIASWTDQAKRLLEDHPNTAPKDLSQIPTAVVKRTGKKRAYPGSGPKANMQQVELHPDRHRPPKRERNPQAASGKRLSITPRGEDTEPADVVAELNPEHQRVLHQRRPSTPLHKRGDDAKKAAAPSAPAAPSEAPAETQAEASASASETEAPQAFSSGFRSFDDYKEGRVSVKPLDRHSLSTGEDVSRSTESEQESFEEEQVYKRRMPIWRIRGVKHPDGLKVYYGAFVTFTAIFLTVLLAVGAALFPIYLEDRRLEFGALFGATLLFWVFYVITAINMRCRVCSCHLFYSRRCLKNVKAHRILGGFPMLAQTIHILCWRWFRCMYCGTAIRLKAEKNAD